MTGKRTHQDLPYLTIPWRIAGLTLLNIGASQFSKGGGVATTLDQLLVPPPQAATPLASWPGPEQPPYKEPPSAQATARDSENQRRDYGSSPDARLIMSKSRERQLREGKDQGGMPPPPLPAAGRLPDPVRQSDKEIGNGEEEEEEDGFWEDIADVSRPAPASREPAGTRGNLGPGGVHLASGTTSAAHLVLHVDVDSFYCAVERLDNPALRGRPLAVKQSNSGGFVAVSYEARAKGVRCGDGVGRFGRQEIAHLREMGAVSEEEAKARCPGLVVLPMRTDRYRQVSSPVWCLNRPDVHCVRGHGGAASDRGFGPHRELTPRALRILSRNVVPLSRGQGGGASAVRGAQGGQQGQRGREDVL